MAFADFGLRSPWIFAPSRGAVCVGHGKALAWALLGFLAKILDPRQEASPCFLLGLSDVCCVFACLPIANAPH